MCFCEDVDSDILSELDNSSHGLARVQAEALAIFLLTKAMALKMG